MKAANGVETLEITANLSNGPGVIHPTLIWDDQNVILADTGLPGLLPQFRAAIDKTGVAFDELNKIIITHHDWDHIGSLAAILKASPRKIEVLAHVEEKPYIQAERRPLKMTPEQIAQMQARLNSMPEKERLELQAMTDPANLKAEVTHPLVDGEELPICGGIVVIHTPGHTLGHICLYLKQSRTLIAGDALAVNEEALVPGPRIFNFDSDQAMQSLKKLTRYDMKTVICYHGGVYSDNVNDRIAELTRG